MCLSIGLNQIWHYLGNKKHSCISSFCFYKNQKQLVNMIGHVMINKWALQVSVSTKIRNSWWAWLDMLWSISEHCNIEEELWCGSRHLSSIWISRINNYIKHLYDFIDTCRHPWTINMMSLTPRPRKLCF